MIKDWDEKEKENLGDELADVLMYLIRLSDKCNIDLPKAVLNKINKNSLKYPVEIVKGSSKLIIFICRKYTEYKNN